MRRKLPALAVTLALLAGACGGEVAGPTTSLTSTPPVTDTLPGAPGSTTGSTTGAASTTLAVPVREPAPDFTLQLGEGGAYTLSEGEKPVYLVFWAEW